MSIPAELLSQALGLAEEDRRELLGHLSLSLPTELGGEFAAEWAEEIDRRLEALDQGAMPEVPADEVFAEARLALEQKRRA